jgi:4-hydroxy-tetrahydrodipicolinate synthase
MNNNIEPRFVSAICAPLTGTDQLHEEGLAAHLDEQWSAGIHGVLVAGTMGLMQLQRDDTYQALCRRSIELTKGRGEIMIGAGDTSLARTLARVEFINSLRHVDGVATLRASKNGYCFA